MKSKIKVLLVLSLLFVFPSIVNAAGTASISGPSSVEVGSTFTTSVTVKNTAAWNIKINSSGSTSGCSQNFSDVTSNGNNTTKTFSVKCKATSIGAIGFTVTGDITSADGLNTNVSLSKRVTVTEVKPKSSDNFLKDLSIDGYKLTPEFNKDTLEYSVTVPSTVNKVNILATKNDSTASIDGIGEKEVVEGSNPFEIVVTAQNGASKTYKINVIVEDINPIVVKINNKEFSVVKRSDKLEKPTGFDETTVKIGDIEVPAFKSDILKITLVGIKDSDGNISLAIYNNGKYELYNEINSNQITIYLLDLPKNSNGFITKTIKINDKEVKVYKYKDNSKYSLVYGKNVETGQESYYMYDEVEKTFQRYNDEQIKDLENQIKNYLYVIYAFSGCLILIFISFIITKCAKKKARKKLKQRELDNDSKNEEIIKEIMEDKKKKK